MANPNPLPPPAHGKWKPGQSGNPAGRPKSKPLTDAINRLLASNPEQADRIGAALLARAEGGDVAAIREYGDRVQGKVPQAIVGDDDHPPIKAIVTGVVRDGDD